MPRQSITEAERKALREWYSGQYPKPRQKACIEWFQTQFNHRIQQSTVSESLSEKYSHLDAIAATNSKRKRHPQWPILEDELDKWQDAMRSSGINVSGEMLIAQAKIIWPTIPEYHDKSAPEFSNGWLSRFKQRRNLKKDQQMGTSRSTLIRPLMSCVAT